MKIINKISVALGLVAGLLSVQSCTKQSPKLVAQQQDDFSNSSLVQVYIAAVNATRNYVYVDGAALNGAAMTSGSLFPSGAATIGANIQPGVRAFLVRDTLTTATQVPLSFAENLQVGKRYTIFVYDTITALKQKTAETNIEIPKDTTARIRFANFVYSPTAIPAVDIFSKKKNANIFTNVQITDVTGYIPHASGITDTFYIRPTGTTSNLQNFRPATSSVPAAFVDIIAILTPTEKRSYTLVFRGGYRATTTTNGTVRTLSTFINN